MQVGIVFVGVVMDVATLLTRDIGLPGDLVEGSGALRRARTMAFTTLVLAQLFNCFNARSERVSAFHNLFANPLLWGAIGLSVLRQVAVVYVPFPHRPFGTTAMSGADWSLRAAKASTVLWANELCKLLARWRRHGAPGRPLSAGGGGVDPAYVAVLHDRPDATMPRDGRRSHGERRERDRW